MDEDPLDALRELRLPPRCDVEDRLDRPFLEDFLDFDLVFIWPPTVENSVAPGARNLHERPVNPLCRGLRRGRRGIGLRGDGRNGLRRRRDDLDHA